MGPFYLKKQGHSFDMMGSMETVLIIGGGASGLAASIAAAQAARMAGKAVRVVVCEADDRVGRSVLATGNGRCNFSNACIDPTLYRNGDFVAEALDALDRIAVFGGDAEAGWAPTGGRDSREDGTSMPTGGSALDPVLAFFSDLGLLWREEGEGRLYPLANKATSVLDVLRARMTALGVEERTEARVTAVESPRSEGGRWFVRFADGAVEHADAVVLACGGPGLERIELPEGLSCAPGRPVLGPLAVEEERLVKTLDNIRVRCAVSLAKGGASADSAAVACDLQGSDVAAKDSRVKAREEGDAGADAAVACDLQGFGVAAKDSRVKAREDGELLFRSYGVSGIAVFNLSRLAEPGDLLCIDLLPAYDEVDCISLLRRRATTCALLAEKSHLSHPNPSDGGSPRASTSGLMPPTGEDILRGMLLPPVARAVLKAAGLKPEAPFAASDAPALARALKGFSLTVCGIGDARQCQVTRGGLDPAAFRPATCEAHTLPGVFATGEALDVDAPCGGYNLHWAWATGLLAGTAAATH